MLASAQQEDRGRQRDARAFPSSPSAGCRAGPAATGKGLQRPSPAAGGAWTPGSAGLLVGVAAWAGDTPLPASDIVLVHAQLLLFGLAAAAIAVVVATFVLEPGRTYGIGALIVVVMYVLHLVAQVVAPLEWMGYLSLFRYWRPLEQFATGQFAWMEATVLALIVVIGTALAVALFRRRDIVT